MALESCKECGKQISTLATSCPGCGAPRIAQPQVVTAHVEASTVTGWHVLGIVAVLAGAFYGAIHIFGSGTGTQEVAAQPASVKVDLDSFYADGRANEVAAQEKLRGKTVEIHGVVGDIATSMGSPEVSIVTPGGSLAAEVPTDEAAALRPDQSVTLVCAELHYAGTDGSRGAGCRVTLMGKVEAGVAKEMNRARNVRAATEFVGNVAGDVAKSLGDELKAAATAMSKSASQATAASNGSSTSSSLDASVLAIDCKPESKAPIVSIWPTFYLAGDGALCFNVKSWPGYTGTNCVANGGNTQWAGTVIVSEDGESKGRDDTTFRVNTPVVTSDRVHYVIEWSRGAGWRPMQDVDVNRVTGVAISSMVTMHGGESYTCSKEAKAL